MRPNSIHSKRAARTGQDSQRGKRGQAGSVILEAMIAILIFSIGILGLIGMQVTAVGNVSDAKYRADASFAADQIIGQMWASRVTATVGGLTMVTADPTYAYPGAGANAVVTAWAASSVGVLPQGSAVIAIEPTSQQQVTVTLSWLPPKAAAPHIHTAVAYIN